MSVSVTPSNSATVIDPLEPTVQAPRATPTPVDETSVTDVRTTLDISSKNATEELYQATIGPVNATYYQEVFRRFEEARHVAPHWNWAAALCTLNWLLFRRLHIPALVYITLLSGAFLACGFAWLVVPLSSADAWSLLITAISLCIVIPGFYGNALLFSSSRQRMTQAVVATTTLEQACAQLHGQAATRRRLLAQVGVSVLLLLAAAAAYLQWPGDDMRALLKPLANTTGLAHLGAPAPAASKYAATIALLPPSAPARPSPQPATAASAASASAAAPVVPSAATSTPMAQASAASPTNAASHPSSSIASVARAEAPSQAVSKPSGAALKPPSAAPAALPASRAVPAPVKTGPYFVNVGLFAQASNAERALQKLKDAQLPATAQVLGVASGARTRVRVGPLTSQAAAQAAVQKIHALQLDAVIVAP